MSMTFATVICDADDPCSVNTAHDPESSLAMSPRSTSRPLYFWYWGSNSEFLRWQRSISDATWTFLPLFLASSIFWLSSAAMPVFSSIFHSFSTAAFASGILMLEASEFTYVPCCNDLIIDSFCSDVIFVLPVRHTFQSYSHRFVGIDNTSIFGLVFPNIATSFLVAIYWFFRHCCWHRHFQLSTNVFSWCVEILHHLVQWRRYHVIVWHYRALVSR